MGNFCCGDRSDYEAIDDTGVESALPNLNLGYNLDKKDHFNILSYNIFIRPPPIRTRNDDYKDERLEEFIKELPNYDIVCLQEMFGLCSFRRKNFIDSAKNIGLAYSSKTQCPGCLSGFLCDAGLLTMSRFPIVSTEFRRFPRGLGPDYLVEKGALYTKIKINDAILHLFSTHTQACYAKNAKYLVLLIEQLRCCRQFVVDMLQKHNYKSEDLVIILGDFNADGREPMSYKVKEIEKIYPTIREYPKLTKGELFHQYEVLLSILSNDFQDDIEEMLFERYGEHPITFGDFLINEKNEILPMEKQLTFTGGLCSSRRLDYIFKLTPKSILSSRQEQDGILDKPVLQPKKGSAKVKKFFVQNKKFTQLSDHYGVKITIEIKGGTSGNNRNDSINTESLSDSEPGMNYN